MGIRRRECSVSHRDCVHCLQEFSAWLKWVIFDALLRMVVCTFLIPYGQRPAMFSFMRLTSPA